MGVSGVPDIRESGPTGYPGYLRDIRDIRNQDQFFFWNVSLSIETPLRTPPPDKPWARPTRTRVRTVYSAILRLAGVLHGHNLLRAPHKHLKRLCKCWSLVPRITSEVAAAGAAATVSSLSLSVACPSSAARSSDMHAQRSAVLN